MERLIPQKTENPHYLNTPPNKPRDPMLELELQLQKKNRKLETTEGSNYFRISFFFFFWKMSVFILNTLVMQLTQHQG